MLLHIKIVLVNDTARNNTIYLEIPLIFDLLKIF